MAKKLPDSWIACDRFKKKVSSKSLQVINSLLRERQTEDDLIKGLKLVVEFTPTKFDEDYFYSDRGHMAISYDNNHFFFNINPQYTKGTPENRTKRMVQLVNSWTGIRGDWSSQVEEIIAEQIQTIDQQRTNFYNELQEAGKHRNHWRAICLNNCKYQWIHRLMYYLSKGFQLIGLLIIGAGFLTNFPILMDYKLLGIGLIFFIMGWIVHKFGLSSS